MVDFGITGEWAVIIRYVELFLASGLLLILVGTCAAYLFSRFRKRKQQISTNAKAANASMRQLQSDENRYFIKTSMKPHFHGYVKIGYVEPMKYGCHIFDNTGQIKGIVSNAQKGREHLRGVHRVAKKYHGE